MIINNINNKTSTTTTMGAGASNSYQAAPWRKEAVGYQLNAQANVCSRLRDNGQRCEPYFVNNLNKARDAHLVSKSEYRDFREINRNGNRAKHENW